MIYLGEGSDSLMVFDKFQTDVLEYTDFDANLERRDFVNELGFGRINVLTGMGGDGKTTGIFQFLSDGKGLYIKPRAKTSEYTHALCEYLRDNIHRYSRVAIENYTWILGHEEELDQILVALSWNDNSIVVSDDNFFEICELAENCFEGCYDVVNTVHRTYDEYLRMEGKERTAENAEAYMRSGCFVNGEDTSNLYWWKSYIDSKIIPQIKSLHPGKDEGRIRTELLRAIVFSIYDAFKPEIINHENPEETVALLAGEDYFYEGGDLQINDLYSRNPDNEITVKKQLIDLGLAFVITNVVPGMHDGVDWSDYFNYRIYISNVNLLMSVLNYIAISTECLQEQQYNIMDICFKTMVNSELYYTNKYKEELFYDERGNRDDGTYRSIDAVIISGFDDRHQTIYLFDIVWGTEIKSFESCYLINDAMYDDFKNFLYHEPDMIYRCIIYNGNPDIYLHEKPDQYECLIYLFGMVVFELWRYDFMSEIESKLVLQELTSGDKERIHKIFRAWLYSLVIIPPEYKEQCLRYLHGEE